MSTASNEKISVSNPTPDSDAIKNFDYKVISHIFTQSDWVHRINEVITILDDSSYNLNKISLDCTPPITLPLYRNIYLSAENTSQHLVPLGVLQKETLSNLDISLQGRTCPTISSSEHNQFLKNALVDFFTEDVYGFTPNKDLLDIVEKIICTAIDNRPHKSPNFTLDIEPLLKYFDSEPSNDELNFKLNIFLDILEILVEHFILFAVVDKDNIGKRVVIKYSYESPATKTKNTKTATDRLSRYIFAAYTKKEERKPKLDFPQFNYPKKRIWRQASHHLTLCCPDELEISVIKNEETIQPTESSTLNKQKFILPEIIDDVNKFSFSSSNFSAILTPKNRGTRKWAVYSAVFLFVFGVASIIVRKFDISPNFSLPNSAVSILISSFSLIIALLSTRREHIYVAQSLGKYRKILSLTATTIFLVAILSSVPLNSKISIIGISTTTWSLIWILVYIIIILTAINTILVEIKVKKIIRKSINRNWNR